MEEMMFYEFIALSLSCDKDLNRWGASSRNNSKFPVKWPQFCQSENEKHGDQVLSEYRVLETFS
jgi:hypothetical protein